MLRIYSIRSEKSFIRLNSLDRAELVGLRCKNLDEFALPPFIDVFCSGPYHPDMRTERVDIDDARNQLAELIAFASEGGEVIIVQDGRPLARLIGANDTAAYKSLLPTHTEFSSDEEALAWDADGWEEVA